MSNQTWSDLSEDQRRVVEAELGPLMVVAAAGSGKTRVLVARYLRHVLEDGFRPDQILTITFTRKAAAEMKHRIVAKLVEVGRPDDAQAAESGPVSTIHAFCERLLRECSIEAGLDPDFRVLDESETPSWTGRALREAFAAAEEDPYADRVVKSLALEMRYVRTDGRVVLEEAVQGVLGALRGSSHTWAEVRARHGDPDTTIRSWRRSFWSHLDISVRTSIGPDAEALIDDTTSPEFEARVVDALKGKRIPKFLNGGKGLDEWFEAARRSAEKTCGLVWLATEAWRRLDDRMQAEQALDFSALEARGVQLIAGSEVVRARVSRQYRAVLVDESQDLSPMQHRLIDSLRPASLLLVGDSQQSIYAFRQAEVRLFQERMERTPVLRLARNYRSTAGVLAFVDTVFASAWKGGYVPMSEMVPDTEDPFAQRRADVDAEDTSVDAASIEFWEVPRQQEHSVAQWVGELIAEGESPRDIAVLVRRSGTAQSLLNYFDQIGVPARIVGGSEKFYTRLEVRDLAVLLRAIANPEDDFALLATLLGPAVGVSLDTAILLAVDKPIWPNLATRDTPIEADRERIANFLSWFTPLTENSDRYSAAELLSRVMAEAPYLEAIARRPRRHQALANVRKLFRLAAARPELGPAEFARQIREIRELRHKEGDAPALDDGADAVTILTIHKAKGLEFPVVVVPETLTSLVRNIQDFEIDRREGLVATSAGPTKGQYHAFVSEKRKGLDAEEEKRLLYVAMTRAQRRLCLVVSPNARSGTIAKVISEATGYPGTPVPGVRMRIARPESGF